MVQSLGLRFAIIRLPRLLLLGSFFLISGRIEAQSGRRVREAPSPPAGTSASPTPTPAIESNRTSLVVTRSVPASNYTVASSTAYVGFVSRLQESSHLTVTEEKEMRRKDASELAMAMPDGYVVWLQLDLDVPDSEKAAYAQLNPKCMVVTYILFAPSTGKIKSQGRVYQPGYQSICNGTVSRPSPFPDGPQPKQFPAEYTLRKAGREAADRVMEAVGIPTPKTSP